LSRSTFTRTATWEWNWSAPPKQRPSAPSPFIGKGNKNAADGAAVDAMRAFLGTVAFDGVIVIGEGEKDNAPMLFNGEHVGTGNGPAADIAVDSVRLVVPTAVGPLLLTSGLLIPDGSGVPNGQVQLDSANGDHSLSVRTNGALISGRGGNCRGRYDCQKAEQQDGPLCVAAVFLTASTLVPPHADR
jgi:hypothetical protein